MRLARQFQSHKGRELFGVSIQTSWAALMLYEYLLGRHAKELKGIVELGTGTGGVTLFFGLWGAIHNWPVVSFDTELPDPRVFNLLNELGVELITGDLFSPLIEAEITARITAEPVLLISDNGKKKRELAMFGPHVVPGSIVIVHDWEREVGPQHIPPELEPYEPWHSQSMALDTRAAVLHRRQA